MLKKLLNIIPQKGSKWRSIALIGIAIVIGLGIFMAKESEITSYMSDDPKACINCHVMVPVYNGWMHSSHREWASCNDCHVPHNNVFNKYFFKAKDGLYHASIFTLRMEPEVMFMRKESQEVVQSNCVRCHTQQVTQTKYNDFIQSHKANRTERKCWTCHREIPHGRVHGISTVHYNVAPIPTDIQNTVIPKWLEINLNNKQ